jgi:PAS domain S-box-containing protein
MEETNKLQQLLAESKQREKELENRVAELTKLVNNASAGPASENKNTNDTLLALEKSEARLRMAIEATNLGTWDYQPLTGELTWSDECRKIYGAAPDAVIDFGIFAEHIYPADKDFVEREIQRSMDPDGSARYDITYRITRFANGDVRWIRAQGKVYFDSKKEVERFIGTVIDITETKLAFENIKKSERLFKSIAINIPRSLVIVFDKNHRYLFVDGDLMAKFGYSSNDYIGKHPTEVGPIDRYEASKQYYDRVLAGEQFSVERVAENGDIYMAHLVPLKDDAGEVYAGLIIAVDITEFKQAEEKSAKLAAIIESSDDAIISKTLEGIITSWNDSAQRIFGYTAEEMIGQPILKLIPPDRQEEEPLILSRLRKGERVEHFETKRVAKDERILDISLTVSPVRNKAGLIIGVSKIARDITEKKQEEIKKNDFIAMVSHELKTPLTSMKSYVQVLLSKAKKNGDTFDINALTRADVQTSKMTSMIHDFLSLARLEEGKIVINKHDFDLHSLIEETANDAKYLTSAHTIKLHDCEHIVLNADRDKIGQVLVNLLSNAIKYSPKGGNVIIGCEKMADKVKIYVSDEGVGINAEDQKRLFERFYRSKNEKIKTVSGFGIGLYLVSEILKYHDSKIQVESIEGKGSTFFFIIDAKN